MSQDGNNPLCPKCNAPMVLRTAKKGRNAGKQFYGCSRYRPKWGCNGTRPYSNKDKDSTSNNNIENSKIDDQKLKVEGNPLSDAQRSELQKLRDRLLNLSSCNRSIRLNRLYARWTFDLGELNVFGDQVANEIIQSALQYKSEISLLPMPSMLLDAKQVDIHRSLSEKIKYLSRSVNEIEREKGLHDLYIGFPFLIGKPAGSEDLIQAPVFLIPVRLEKVSRQGGSSQWVLRASKDIPVTFNKTLFYAMAKKCGFSINQSLFEKAPPDKLYSDPTFMKWTHEMLKNCGINCEMDPHSNDKVIDPVLEFSIPNARSSDRAATRQIPETFPIGGLKICQHAVLGHFPQSNSSIIKDYEMFLDDGSQELLGSLICFLSSDDNDKIVSSTASSSHKEILNIDSRSERENFYLLPSDSSQDQILLALKNGTKGLVIWGPPGTGKSQTIVNIIGESLYLGKSVLLVSQKRAALDVVYDRLSSKGLKGLVALVHDSKADKKNLFKQISDEIGKIASSETLISRDPSEELDPSEEIDRIGSILKSVQTAYLDKEFGISLGEIYRKLGSRNKQSIAVGSEWLKKRYSDLEALKKTLSSCQRFMVISDAVKPLQGIRNSFVDLDNAERDEIKKSLETICLGQELSDAIYVLAVANDRQRLIPIPPGATTSAFRMKYTQIALRKKNSTKLFEKLRLWIGEYFAVRDAKRVLTKLARSVSPTVKKVFTKNFAQTLLDQVRSGTHELKRINDLSQIIWENFYDLKGCDQAKNQLDHSTQKIVDALSQINCNEDWGDVFERSVLNLWLEQLERKHSVITQIRSGQIDSLRDQYKSLLRIKNEFCVESLRCKYRTSSDSVGKDEYYRLLNSDIRKNDMSIRKLIERHIDNGNFKKLLPVWLVSPETVSDVFPCKKDLFDVVIFDEASQCTVEHGLPAVFRGKQVVIAGDEKQLPPSYFGESHVEEEDDIDSDEVDANATEEESLLTLAQKTLSYKPVMLKWHYRSLHEELVTFSNEAFYEGKMLIAPNVIPFQEGNIPAITWHGVNGYWRTRTNEEEARKVIELIRKHLTSDTPPTIGVITFNGPQKNLIENMLDKVRSEDPEFDHALSLDAERPIDKQLFVKNIENVQGDEREVILFSVAYARSEPRGRVNIQFGSLNKSGGEKRLNVAITRAIKAIEIVASINPENDLDVAMAQHMGPKYLKDYLCFAKAVSDQDFDRAQSILNRINPNLNIGNDGARMTESPFEEEVLNELERLGYEVHTQVGQSGYRIDLAIVHPNNPNRYLLGIECDGAMFHSGVSVRERDVFRQKFLEDRGWVIHRIWSTNWWADKDREIARIRSLVLKLVDN
jgi:superfamily I DNA and/or RNA helicase/very-short-patch-repair endonuclease